MVLKIFKRLDNLEKSLFRLDNLYDCIDELEDAIAEVTRKMSGVAGEQVTAEILCKLLLEYVKICSKMSDGEKKQFFQGFIKSIESEIDSKSKSRILKHIEFNFTVGMRRKNAIFYCARGMKLRR